MRARVPIVALSVTLACQARAADPPKDSLTRVSIDLGGKANHLVEIVRFADVWYTTNSNNALTAVRLLADGGLEPVFDALDMGIRCATADVHPSSATLLCSNEYDGRVYALSLADPSAPVLVDTVVVEAPLDAGELVGVPVSDIHVWGDEVWLAGYVTGIWRGTIDADGQLSSFERVAEPGNALALAHAGAELVTLVGDRGLVLFGLDGPDRAGSWGERASVALDGPLIDLDVDDDRAVVALGSAGAATIDLATRTPLAWATVQPPMVVTSVALRGDRLAVGGLTGLYMYRIEPDAAPTLTGYSRSGAIDRPQPGSLLDLQFETDDELLASDWYRLHRYTIADDGVITELETPTGVYRRPGDPIVIPIRNPGELELDVEARVFGGKLARVRVAARAEATLTIDATLAAESFTPDSTRYLELYRTTTDGVELERYGLLVATTAADHDPALVGKPAPGMLFPAIQLARWQEDSPLTLPLPDQAMRVVFFSEDCQAMWPQILDVAWLWRRGQLDGGATPVLASNGPIMAGQEPERFAVRMGVVDLQNGYFEFAGAEIDAFNEPLNPLYEYGFVLDRLGSAAAHPTDYLVDAEGRVLAVEREYRGAFALGGTP